MDNWVVAIGLLGSWVFIVFGIVALIYCRIVKYIYKKTGKKHSSQGIIPGRFVWK